jgi:hypothetical protein
MSGDHIAWDLTDHRADLDVLMLSQDQKESKRIGWQEQPDIAYMASISFDVSLSRCEGTSSEYTLACPWYHCWPTMT